MRVEFLVVCHPNDASEEIWRLLLQNALETNLDEYGEDEVKEFLQFTLSRRATQPSEDGSPEFPREICCLELDLPDELQNSEIVTQDFAKALEEEGGALYVLKFYDDTLLTKNLKFMQELFALKMKLRKALSLVYLSACCDKPFSLLHEDSVEIPSSARPTQNEMQNTLENEFFHLLFSQYVGLNKRKSKSISKPQDLLELVRTILSFEELRDELERTPITNEDDQGFLASLKERMDTMEKLRNSVAHNRTPSQTAINQFEATKNLLDEGLEEFLSRFSKNS